MGISDAKHSFPTTSNNYSKILMNLKKIKEIMTVYFFSVEGRGGLYGVRGNCLR